MLYEFLYVKSGSKMLKHKFELQKLIGFMSGGFWATQMKK